MGLRTKFVQSSTESFLKYIIKDCPEDSGLLCRNVLTQPDERVMLQFLRVKFTAVLATCGLFLLII